MESNNTFACKFKEMSVSSLLHMLEDGQLNLQPAFQRKSVWSKADRAKLIHTLLQAWPVPAIFLRRRKEEGREYFDVLDGKQRLESIFMFIGAKGFGRQGFDVRWAGESSGKSERLNWSQVRRRMGEASIMGYSIPVIEVDCESLATVVDLFIRINSTGKPLTRQERTHAKYNKSGLLKMCLRIAKEHRQRLATHGVIKDSQVARMKDVELITELIVSMSQGEPVNKKLTLDRVLSADGIDGRSLRALRSRCTFAIKQAFKVLPDLSSTRFHNHSDFYSLVYALATLAERGAALKDRRAQARAGSLVRRLSLAVDSAIVDRRQRSPEASRSEIAERYLAAVERSSDNAVQRKQRHEILMGLLEGLFDRKDARRTFSIEQRRLLWHSSEEHSCVRCGCMLDWNNFQIDHVRPHSKGGRTELSNADLLCAPCNSSKGDR